MFAARPPSFVRPLARALSNLPDTWTPIKFVVYHGGAPHPKYGDEAREESILRGDSWAYGEHGEGRPRRAVLALRHPQLEDEGGYLQRLRNSYAERFERGCSVVLVRDEANVFIRGATLLDDWDASSNLVRVLLPQHALRSQEREQEKRDAKLGIRRREPVPAPNPVAEFRAEEVYAGWPAFSGELASPLRLLAKEAAYMWPGPLTGDVTLTRQGEPLSPKISFGALLRDVRGVCVNINGVFYPLELDCIASARSEKAQKEADRETIRKVVRAHAGGIAILLLMIFALQVKIEQLSREKEQRRAQLVAELERERALQDAERALERGRELHGWHVEFDSQAANLELTEALPYKPIDLEDAIDRPACPKCSFGMEWSKLLDGPYGAGWQCDAESFCGSIPPGTVAQARWHCDLCRADICEPCALRLPRAAPRPADPEDVHCALDAVAVATLSETPWLLACL